MNINDTLFQALGPIGAMPNYYTNTDTTTQFTQLIWTDNTIKQQPSEAAKNLISYLFQSISISSACVYGIPKVVQYPKYTCPASSSAASYNFYVSSIISNLSSLTSFLNIVRSNIEGIINGTTTDAAFYDTCFSLLKINNFTYFLVQAADPLTKNFSDTITIQPLLPQIDQISGAVKEIVSKSDQLRNSIVNKTATQQDVLSYNDTINSFINIIPQYTQAYSNLLIQLQNEFVGIYNKENESENKTSNKKNIDIEFDLFVQKMKSYINPIQKVVLLSSILLSQKPFAGVCDNLLISLKSIVDNANIMICNYSKIFHFRGDEFESYKKNFLDSQNKNLALLQEIKAQFTSILSTDVPPAFQNYMNEELKTSLDIINNGQNSISFLIKDEFEKILKLIQNDPRSVVFRPILASNIPSNQISTLSLESIRILHTLVLELRKNPINFQIIKDKLNALHPAINYLLAVVYNDIYIRVSNEMNRSKSGKKKKIKASNFPLPPEIIVLNQKKTHIENLFISFDESLHKLSPESKILRIIQDNCTLKAILLALAISALQTSPDIINEILQLQTILEDYLDNYFTDNKSTINEIIRFFDDKKNIPDNPKLGSQFEIVNNKLKETIQLSEKVITKAKISNVFQRQERINLIKEKINEYEKMSLLLSSIEYIDESYFPDNVYHDTISNLQQNMTNIVKNYKNSIQICIYQNLMNLSKIFIFILYYIKNILPHSSVESNYSNYISVDLQQNRLNMTPLSSCGIGFDPQSLKTLFEIQSSFDFLKEKKEFYQKKIDQGNFKNNLTKSFKTFDEFYSKVEESLSYLNVCEVNNHSPLQDCIAPIIKHYTLHINYNLDKFALAFINNLPNVVQLAMKLNDLLHELPNVNELKLENVPDIFKNAGTILFQRTSEIPLITDYFKDDKKSLNSVLQNKKELVNEAINNLMRYLSMIANKTIQKVCNFEIEQSDQLEQKQKHNMSLYTSMKEYEEYRKHLDESRNKALKEYEENRKKINESKKEELKESKIEYHEKKDEIKSSKIDYKEPFSLNINPIFGMGLYLKCGFNPETLYLNPDSDSDLDLSIDIDALSDFSSPNSLQTSVFQNVVRQVNEITNDKEKDNNLVLELTKQLMPPDYLLTAIQCGLLKETQDNKNEEEEDENDNDDPLNALKMGGVDDDDDEDENEKSGEFDTENDPILGNKQLVDDDDDFFESCSDDDDDEEEEEKQKVFFPWS